MFFKNVILRLYILLKLSLAFHCVAVTTFLNTNRRIIPAIFNRLVSKYLQSVLELFIVIYIREEGFFSESFLVQNVFSRVFLKWKKPKMSANFHLQPSDGCYGQKWVTFYNVLKDTDVSVERRDLHKTEITQDINI